MTVEKSSALILSVIIVSLVGCGKSSEEAEPVTWKIPQEIQPQELKVEGYTFATDGNSLMTSLVATEDQLVVSTAEGKIVGLSIDRSQAAPILRIDEGFGKNGVIDIRDHIEVEGPVGTQLIEGNGVIFVHTGYDTLRIIEGQMAGKQEFFPSYQIAVDLSEDGSWGFVNNHRQELLPIYQEGSRLGRPEPANNLLADVPPEFQLYSFLKAAVGSGVVAIAGNSQQKAKDPDRDRERSYTQLSVFTKAGEPVFRAGAPRWTKNGLYFNMITDIEVSGNHVFVYSHNMETIFVFDLKGNLVRELESMKLAGIARGFFRKMDINSSGELYGIIDETNKTGEGRLGMLVLLADFDPVETDL